jgi:hypothetical protein
LAISDGLRIFNHAVRAGEFCASCVFLIHTRVLRGAHFNAILFIINDFHHVARSLLK